MTNILVLHLRNEQEKGWFEALTKLKHAWDMWNSTPYLVTTDVYMDKVKQLVEGSFHEMGKALKIVNWTKIENTLLYTQLVNFETDEYTSRIAKTVKEACELVDADFEHVCEMNDVKIFRKRK